MSPLLDRIHALNDAHLALCVKHDQLRRDAYAGRVAGARAVQLMTRIEVTLDRVDRRLGDLDEQWQNEQTEAR